MSSPETFDVVILGGGSGITAAYWAEQDGKSVALIDAKPHALGGTCVNYGCIPTKGLIQAAEVLETVRRAAEFGIQVDLSSIKVDFAKVTQRVRDRRQRAAGSVKKYINATFTPLYSRARFVGDRLLELEDGRQVQGETVFVTTGARPAVPPIPGLEDVPYWTNEEVMELTEQPESLIVLGGGYIGCELGHFFSTLGTEVTVIERDTCLLREDQEVRELFTQRFKTRVDLYNGHSAKEVLPGPDGRIGVKLEGPRASDEPVWADKLLVAIGRTPNTDTLDVNAAGIELDPRGWIKVDEQLRTTNPSIYAYGDVIGQGMFKHTSSYEGELAYKNSQGAELKVDYRTNPHAVFSYPEIGSVGLTEEECEERGLAYKAHRAEYSSHSKGQIIGAEHGFAKLLVERDSDRILGFHMIGPGSADLIHEVVVAMNAGQGTADLIRNTIHVHPTMSELTRKVFDALA